MKKVLIVLSLVLFSLTILEISSSFAVFESNVTGDFESSLAKWQILVNNSDINGVDRELLVDSITYKDRFGEVTDTFAPGVTGEFILEIDPQNTDVSFTYELKFDTIEQSLEQIKIESVEGVNGTVLTYQDGVYSKLVTLEAIENGIKDFIKITFRWEFDDKYNESDSSLGLDPNSEYIFPFTIKFSQYLG